MFKRILTGVLAVAGLTSPALAYGNCGQRAVVVARLQDGYSERLTAGGLQATQPVQTMIEVWASPETGTFTVLLTDPSGMSCIVAAGTDFFSDPKPAAHSARDG